MGVIFQAAPPALTARLLEQVPDQPKWVDIRGMLLTGVAAVAGVEPGGGFVVRVQHGARSVVGVVGQPAADVIAASGDGVTEWTPVIAQPDNAAYVADSLARRGDNGGEWRAELMIAHTLVAAGGRVAPPEGVAVRLLAAADSLAHLPPGLRHEMTHARELGPVAAVLIDGVAASFCYPCWTTERWWDVSIDTLEPFRGRDLGRLAFRHLYDEMQRGGRRPVWSALESNAASLRLARKIGFLPVDRIAVVSRGHWALLSGGFVASGE